MVTSIDGYELKCEDCGIKRIDAGFDLDMTYLWSNQHGMKIRLFCHRCGAVHDVTISGRDGLKISRRTMNCAIFNIKGE